MEDFMSMAIFLICLYLFLKQIVYSLNKKILPHEKLSYFLYIFLYIYLKLHFVCNKIIVLVINL